MNRRQFFVQAAGGAIGAMLPPWPVIGGSADGAAPSPEQDALDQTAPIQWTISGNNPVIRPGQLNPPWDRRRAGAAHVLRRGDVHRMYYWGGGPAGNAICLAESPVETPNHWRGLGCVLTKQPETEYNVNGPSFPCVLPLDDRHWLMYFCGWGKARTDGKVANRTGLAESFDAGKTWRYVSNEPLIPLDKHYDQEGTGSCWVVRAGDELRMYYTALGDYFPRPKDVRTGHGDVIPRIGIGYMVSRDGYRWTKPLDQLLVPPRYHDMDPYNYIVSKPCVLWDGLRWRMWASTFGYAYRVRELVSRDGLRWQWREGGIDGVLGVGEAGQFDGQQRCYASVLKHEDQYRCWYTGNGFGAAGMGYAVGREPG